MKDHVQSVKGIQWADAGPVWRERVFWMAAGILVLWHLEWIVSDFQQIAFCFVPDWQRFYVNEFIGGLPLLSSEFLVGLFIGWPILLVGFVVARGYLNRYPNFWFFQSRLRLIALWLLLSVLASSSALVAHDHIYGLASFAGWQAWRQGFFPGWLNYLQVSVVPFFLLLWLLPTRKNAGTAGRHTVSKFELSEALENWRNELVAQPQFTADDRRELERHLADSMAESRQRGLGDEESFRQACQKIGSPQQLAREFANADPTKVWRERIFWAAAGIIIFWQVSLIISYVVETSLKLALYFILNLAAFDPGKWLNRLPELLLLLVAILIIRGRMRRVSILAWFFQSRVRLAGLLVLLAGLCGWGQMLLIRMTEAGVRHPLTHGGEWIGLCLRSSFAYLAFGLAPVILAIWFLPKQFRKPTQTEVARA